MQPKIALLRGINVGGNRKIKMTDLKEALVTLNFSEIQTYIQSGNIIFSTKEKKSNFELGKQIQKLILDKFHFEVPVVVFDGSLLEKIISINPYKEKTDFLNRLYVCFFEEVPSKDLVKTFNTLVFQNDVFKTCDNYMFVLYETKQSQSKLTNNLIEKKLKVQTTTRNWKTVLKLLEISTT